MKVSQTCRIRHFARRTRGERSSGKTNSYLGYFPPVKTIKKVVGAPLIGVRLQCRLHARRPCYPNPLFFVVPPVPVKAAEWSYERGLRKKGKKPSDWTASIMTCPPNEPQIPHESKFLSKEGRAAESLPHVYMTISRTLNGLSKMSWKLNLNDSSYCSNQHSAGFSTHSSTAAKSCSRSPPFM